jgi:hypothetical protein
VKLTAISQIGKPNNGANVKEIVISLVKITADQTDTSKSDLFKPASDNYGYILQKLTQ